MNFCFKKSVDFKRIMSDGLDITVAEKILYFLQFYQNYSKECNVFLLLEIM